MPRDDANPVRRHSLRLANFDYRQPGCYFVTVCTHRRRCLFGEVVDGSVQLSGMGEVALACWRAIPSHFDEIQLDAHVVMPNHLHGLIRIVSPAGARHASPLPHGVALGTVVGAFKSAAAKQIRKAFSIDKQTVWQRGYYEHVIRSDAALQETQKYIANNPLQWHLDRENPNSRSV